MFLIQSSHIWGTQYKWGINIRNDTEIYDNDMMR